MQTQPNSKKLINKGKETLVQFHSYLLLSPDLVTLTDRAVLWVDLSQPSPLR